MLAAAVLTVPEDRDVETVATMGGEQITHDDIRSRELVRARRALAYLKAKLGDASMRALVADDVASMMTVMRGWLEASEGRWRSGVVTMRMPGPGAEAFRDWYAAVVTTGRADAMRAGHP